MQTSRRAELIAWVLSLASSQAVRTVAIASPRRRTSLGSLRAKGLFARAPGWPSREGDAMLDSMPI